MASLVAPVFVVGGPPPAVAALAAALAAAAEVVHPREGMPWDAGSLEDALVDREGRPLAAIEAR
jgi:hypothetical protein